MSEDPVSITTLNDFIFCPVSIYFHGLDADTEKLSYQDAYQINGTAAHAKSDAAEYSDRKSVLQGISVYCERYNLCGKIDVFDMGKGILTERKKKIKTVFDGYVFQLYGQCFALREMGYPVKSLRLYSMDDHKTYPIPLPEEDAEMFAKFETTVSDLQNFRFDGFVQSNPLKCAHCIYEPLCAYAVPDKGGEAL